MKNDKEDWIHPDNNIGKTFIDITEEDAYEILEGREFNWVFPVYDKDKNGVKDIVGNVIVNLGDINSEEEE